MQKWSDMPAENLLVILIIVVVVGFVVIWLLLSRSGGMKNKTVIKGDNNRVINQQIDNSVRQMQIHVEARVQTPAAASPPQTSNDGANEFAIYGALMLVTAFLYLRFFEPVVFVSIAVCAFAVGAALALLALSAASMLGDVLAVSSRAAMLLVMSGVAGWFLYDAQQLIDPRLVQAAQSVPLSVGGGMDLIKFVLRSGVLVTTVLSTVICALCMLLAVRAVSVARRVGVAGRLAMLDEETYRRYGVMPTWSSIGASAGILAAMGFMRFYWLPHALSVSQ
jgi:hypothetical protein